MADLSHLSSNYYFPPATHYRSLNPKDLVRFFVYFLEIHSPNDFIVKVTLFAFYTLLRQKEIASIKWEWVDLDNRVIHIESEVMKSRKSFDVPITNQMLKILESLPKTNEYVFNSRVVNGKSVKMHDNYLGAIFRKKGFNKIFNVHGIRAIGRTWMQIENIDPLIAEICLSHAINNNTLSAYIRVDFLFDKRLEVMNRWSDFVESNLNNALNYLNDFTDKSK